MTAAPKKLKLKRFQPKEYEEQATVFSWAKMRENRNPALKFLHANLNGLRLPIGQAVKAKKAGLTLGVPDIFLPVPSERDGRHFNGLYLELKRRDGGRLSEAQTWWIEHLRAMGFRVEVPAGAVEAIACIAQYLGIPI